MLEAFKWIRVREIAFRIGSQNSFAFYKAQSDYLHNV